MAVIIFIIIVILGCAFEIVKSVKTAKKGDKLGNIGISVMSAAAIIYSVILAFMKKF